MVFTVELTRKTMKLHNNSTYLQYVWIIIQMLNCPFKGDRILSLRPHTVLRLTTLTTCNQTVSI